VIDPEEIERLLADLESDRVERTESVNNSAKFCKAICAFANDLPGHRAPGYLCIGVDARGTPSSTPIDERLLETLAGHRNNGQIIPIDCRKHGASASTTIQPTRAMAFAS
jgi:ATP-dependent DNA helicase RecG